MDLALHPMAVPLLGGRGAAAEFRRGQVAGCGHPQGGEDVLVAEAIDILPAHAPHQLTQHDETQVAVGELLSSSGQRLRGEDSLPGLFRAAFEIAQVIVGDKAALVREQMPHGDLLFARRRELRDVSRHGVVQPQLFLFGKEHDAGGRGDGLGERSHVEERVGRHRQGRGLDLPLAVCLKEGDLSVAADEHHAARHFSRLEVRGYHVVNLGKGAGVQSHVRRLGLGEPCRRVARGCHARAEEHKREAYCRPNRSVTPCETDSRVLAKLARYEILLRFRSHFVTRDGGKVVDQASSTKATRILAHRWRVRYNRLKRARLETRRWSSSFSRQERAMPAKIR